MKLSKQEIQERNEVIDRVFSLDGNQSFTGYPKIDDILGVVEPGDTILLGGESGVGKSLVASNIAVNVAKQGKKVLYLDLENGERTGIKRLLSIWSGVEFKKWNNKEHIENAYGINHELSEKIEYWDHFSLENLSGFSENSWKTIIKYVISRSANKDTKPQLVIIDPLQDLESETESTKTYNEQGHIIKALKNLAQKLSINILICHHLRKPGTTNSRYVADVDDKEARLYRIPEKDDFEGSSKIINKSMQVLSVVRAYEGGTKEKRSKTRVEVLKNRNSLTGVGYLYLNEDNLRIENDPVYVTEYAELLDGRLF
ncbi:MAG TPA: DnaB-like helicase C-terminal domain-containing protein [bacterium]|nr:DnaB-like helicase C-terminal domain-containing protein [bacterium]